MKKVRTLGEAEGLLHTILKRIRDDGILFINRPKNAQSLAEFGITATQQRRIIESLRPEDYCGGPEADEKYPWKVVAVFGVTYREVEIYIKFSMGVDNAPVVCLSFHRSEYPMRYQFK